MAKVVPRTAYFISVLQIFFLAFSNSFQTTPRFVLRHQHGVTTSATLSMVNPTQVYGKNIAYSTKQWDIETVASRAAMLAGDLMIMGLGSINLSGESDDISSKFGTRDIVTETDTSAQEIIRSTIIDRFSDHKFLGEEDIAPGSDAAAKAIDALMEAENLWIVDPIDGTTNFAHGMPLSGVIISYASKGRVEFGLIYDPYRKELFTAWRGRGAFLNGKQIFCCQTESLNRSVVCTGSPPNFQSLDACLRATQLLSPQVRTMRMLGSAAIMLSWVACGRLTAYFEADLNVWDLAAGALIIQEAGGKVTDVWGDDYQLQTRNLVSSNGRIHDQLLEQLQLAEMWIK